VKNASVTSQIKEPERCGIRRIEKYVPVIGNIRTYKRDSLKTDMVVVVTVFSFSFPHLSLWRTVGLNRWLDYMLRW
jgi:hypothetical protein